MPPTGACRPRSSAALDGDEPARLLIAEQDGAIAEKAGRPGREIQSLVRSPIVKLKPVA